MTPLLAQFLPEARDLLEQVGGGLLAIEKAPGDAEAVNTVFRAIHTLKGASGLFEVAPMTTTVHAAEDLLNAARDGRLTITPEQVDRLLEAMDQVATWLDDLEAHEALPADAPEVAAGFIAVLRAPLGEAAAVAAAAVAAAAQEAEPAPEWLDDFPEAERMEAWRKIHAGAAVCAVSYEPDQACFFRGEDPLHLAGMVPNLLATRLEPLVAWPPLDQLDPFNSVLRFRLLTATAESGVRFLFRYVPDQVRVAPLAAEALVIPVGEAADHPALGSLAAQSRGNVAALAADVLPKLPAESHAASALRWLLLLAENGAPANWLAALAEAAISGRRPDFSAPATRPAAPPSPGREQARRHILREQRRLLALPCEPEDWPARLQSVAVTVANVLRATGAATAPVEAAAAQALATHAARPMLDLLSDLLGEGEEASSTIAAAEPARPVEAAPDDHRDDAKAAAKVLRVDQAKVDWLMNLVGELVVAKNGLPYLARKAEEVTGNREIARDIKDQYAVVHRIAQDMQAAIMSVRMLPVGQVFQRFPRLVRDLSRKLDKHIELVLVGEDTEADKNVIESLADPLIHMVRNALDHGIEPPAERLAAGKPASGTIRLEARQDNDRVVIEVADDGRGIDPARVRAKALEKGLIDDARAAAMADEDVLMLVFAAGFSTAAQVSDLSGRGVGMDVVRTAVEKAGGHVGIASRVGAGTTVTLTLPLSMAITRVMTLECDGRLFGVPMDAVVETVRIAADDIHRIRDQEAFVLRNAIMPLVRLRRLLTLPEGGDEAEPAVLVVRSGGERMGLVVDDFREGMEVIVKPLEGVLANLPGYQGTALLGDGSVLLVLDLRELLP